MTNEEAEKSSPEPGPEPPEETLEPALVHRKMQVVVIASLMAGLFIYDTGATHLGWPPFWSVGLAINAGVVFSVFLYFFPVLLIVFSLILLLGADFIGDIGYWLTGISTIAYFLTAFRPKKKGETG